MNSPIKFHPIKHATMVIQSKTVTIYVDPVGDPELFSQYPKPDLILITDIDKFKNMVEKDGDIQVELLT